MSEKQNGNIITNLQTFIIQQINSKLKNIKQTQTISGIAQSEENQYGYVDVQLVGENQMLSFINKSGELISIGDTVVVEYKNSLTKGYISRRTGRTVFGCFIVVDTEEQAQTDYIPDRLYIVLNGE